MLIIKYIKLKSELRKIREWTSFHEQLLDWDRSISVSTVRLEYMQHCINLLEIKSDSPNWNLEKELMEINRRFGKYIPDLQQKSRDQKLDKLLK